MPAPISVIIPTLNSAQTLPRCLGALGEAISEGLLAEVIFADGGSSDDTEQIAEEVGATFLSCAKGRGNQLAEAARHARGEWLLFLHSDSILDEGWPRAALNSLSAPNTARYFKLRFDVDSLPAKTVANWANFRARWFGLPYGDQALLISRRLYDSIGGHPEIPLMEDVAIAKKLRGRLTSLPVYIETSAEKYTKQGWIKRSWTNFVTLSRYLAGANPKDLATRYYR